MLAAELALVLAAVFSAFGVATTLVFFWALAA
jgi:hypothetical protein